LTLLQLQNTFDCSILLKEMIALERWKLNLAVLWLGQFLVLAGMTMITPFLPYYLQELGVHEPHGQESYLPATLSHRSSPNRSGEVWPTGTAGR
jgi:hypothetical protein